MEGTSGLARRDGLRRTVRHPNERLAVRRGGWQAGAVLRPLAFLLVPATVTVLALIPAPPDGPRLVRDGRAAAAPAGPEAACLAGPNPAACLIELAVAASLAARDDDRLLPGLAGALALAGRLDAAEAILQRLQREDAGTERDGARRAEAADRILVAELLWAARRDPAHAADLGALDELAEQQRPRRGPDGPARRAQAYSELARLLCRDHTARGSRMAAGEGSTAPAATSGGAEPTRQDGQAPAATRQVNATFAALLERWPAAIEARPPRRQVPDWEALAEALACAGETEAARAALHRAARAAPGTAHPGRVRAFLALGDAESAEATALDVARPDRRAAALLEVSRHAVQEGRRERSAELAGFAVEAAAHPRLAVPERLRVLRGVARLRHASLDDAPGALEAAEAMRAAAEAADPREGARRPQHLLEVAGAFNDLGRSEAACFLATAALEAMAPPASARAAGAGPPSGGGAGAAPSSGPSLLGLRIPPLHGGSLERLPGIGDALRARVAVELYRCGREEDALRLLRELAAAPRATGWVEIRKAALAAGAAGVEPPPGRFPELVAPDQRGYAATAMAEFHAARGEAEPAALWIGAALEAGASGPSLAEAAVRIGRHDLAAQALRRIAPAQLRAAPVQRAMDLLALAALFEALPIEEGAAARVGR